mmetsp:Transcript_7774/g.7342  ORF Transcript_7774/g.7342 Transcript_7774/m.7342 type:complete len:126 (+) Transcript_7774:646-1023(+)
MVEVGAEPKVPQNRGWTTTANQDSAVNTMETGDNLPDNCGFETSSHPQVQTTGVSVETQKTSAKEDVPSQVNSSTTIDTSKVKSVRMEELKMQTEKPTTQEMNTDTGMDPMLGGSKIGKKESCWQ